MVLLIIEQPDKAYQWIWSMCKGQSVKWTSMRQIREIIRGQR